MSQMPGSQPPTDELQFNVVEPAGSTSTPVAVALACVVCRQPLIDRYFAVGDKVICGNCCAQLTGPPKGNAVLRFGTAALFGLGASLGLAAILFAIYAQTGSLIAAAILGYLVAKAIRKGSGGQGGVEYQVLAVVLTYFSVFATFAAIFFREIYKENRDALFTAPAILGAVEFAVKGPFEGGGVIWLIIIGIAIVQAWRLTAARKLPISGPFQVGPRAPIASVSGVRA